MSSTFLHIIYLYFENVEKLLIFLTTKLKISPNYFIYSIFFFKKKKNPISLKIMMLERQTDANYTCLDIEEVYILLSSKGSRKIVWW